MTKKLFLQDSYLQTANAVISASGPGWFQCDQTLFYARSGGQPGDQGWVSVAGHEYEVTDTIYEADRQTIRHLLKDENAEPGVGSPVEQKLNWERRHKLMRMHSVMHLLCSIIPAPVTGGGVGESESRVEFDIQTVDFDKQLITDQLNALIQSASPVTIGEITDEQLDAQPDLVRTMSVQPPRGLGSVRMINIGDKIDYQPCGGTHVKNTLEIGEVLLSSIKSKGKQNKRFVIKLVE